MIKNLFYIVGAVLVLTGCGAKKTEVKEQAEERTIQVRTMTLSDREVTRSVDYTANLTPFEEIYCAPASPGHIKKINVEIGNRVRKGDILVVMDQTQLQQAKIQLTTLETDYNRLKQLHEKGSISDQQYDQMKSQYEIAQSNVSFLEENTKILSPITGVITGKYFEDGELYSGAPNTQVGKAAIVTVQQINPIKAEINIAESYYPIINKDTKVSMRCELFPDEVFEGDIYRIHPTIDAISRTFTVEISIPNQNEKLRPGMYGVLNIDVEDATAMMVPAIAVLKQQGTNERLVYKVENGIAKRVTVTTGVRYDDLIEIDSDKLKLNDQIIVVGQSKVVDGSKVEVVK
ncbi:MAG: efflux RND transporter periplasmic adaptor subunit [Bacteroidales bacterium]|nr:efflux RND transporter periplasmic adaptor subunit [Bacteroidales bacterium]